MALLDRDSDKVPMRTTMQKPQNNLPAVDSGSGMGEEIVLESEEPPDERKENRMPLKDRRDSSFIKSLPPNLARRESLLTRQLHLSENESHTEDEFHRARAVPSPPPAFLRGPVPILSKPMVQEPMIAEHDDDNDIPAQGEKNLEVNLARRRCITFACGKKPGPETEKKAASPPSPEVEQPAEPPKRKCVLTFACPARPSLQTAPSQQKVKSSRHLSPVPSTPKITLPKAPASPKPTPKAHRGSDSTVKNESPKSVRKSMSFVRRRKYSDDNEDPQAEARRFHEFEPLDLEDWVQESTCHRSRLTVNDTLQKENVIRKLAEEVDEEALEEDEADDLEDEDEENENEDDLLEEDDEDDAGDDAEEDEDDEDNVSDEGFRTDDEDGFAISDSEGDDSDYEWWAPGRSTAATSMENIAHLRSAHHRSPSESSSGSVSAGEYPFPKVPKPKSHRKSKAMQIHRPGTPELPDSTDFVCGTLDEDRPLEQAYIACREQKKAAKKKVTPQDIDPTFPTSDPEMDEEDDDDLEEAPEDSDQPGFMHGKMDLNDDSDRRGRGGSKKKSPQQSPRRLRSPPPPVRHRSPAPPKLARSTSPSFWSIPEETSLTTSSWQTFISSTISSRLAFSRTSSDSDHAKYSSSEASTYPHRFTPRTAWLLNHSNASARMSMHDDEGNDPMDIPSRGAIDIFKGLEKKRQRRKEKHYQKHWKANKDRRPKPGKGAERMREVGLELAAYKGKKEHMLSY
ncbi:hypothetical protein H2203_006634 [Taxawa tesnikishii (nom. ined.)]|nr:hypothetical protein H2203_006634 [Dothideales sp. JES 119]